MILILDNRDSFVFNLDQALRALGAATCVVRGDRTTATELLAQPWSAIVLSPGPGQPCEAASLLELVRRAPGELPILGVCLGHQALAEAAGARIARAPQVFHGRCSPVRHDDSGLFAGLENPFHACRYHSLTVDPATLPACYAANAWLEGESVIMGIRHRELPRFGVQFHPESFRTPCGARLLARFVELVRAQEAA